ncbi:transcriptional regulator [Rhizobium leguminosarum]|uniref:transcriptional regulator n=1 Tax=Rhizobium leguminosarum TaxID=384 RepID=UPI00140FB6FB|nr:transcriptional regulator [Rhizobium leguminosarum]QIO60657.1 transcriptional regulator [Rhizobium leguminosarum bv. trifolii]
MKAGPSFEETHPHLKDFAEFVPELNQESDRGATLIATGFLDELFKQILLAFFVDKKASLALVEGFNAPLGTFSTRIASAAALALISERERAEADTLRRIRNEFAHSVQVSFQDQRIRDLCENLTFSIPENKGRGQFTSSAVSLILNLTNRAAYVSQHRRTETTWRL